MTEIAARPPISDPAWLKWALLTLIMLMGWNLTVFNSEGVVQDARTIPDEPTYTADYYVCYNATDCNAGAGSGWSTGSPANDGLSKSTPFACPEDIEDLNSGAGPDPGDAIMFGDGTYTMTNCADVTGIILNPGSAASGIDGTAGNEIVLFAENKHGAVWDCEETGQDGNLMSGKAIEFENNDYWIVDGFEMKRCDRMITSYQTRPSTFITLKNLKIHDIGFSGVYSGVYDHDWTMDSLEVFNIWFDTHWATPEPDERCIHEHAFYLNGYNLTLTNSISYDDNGGGSLDVGGYCDFDGNFGTDNPGFTHTIHVINNTLVGDGCPDWENGFTDNQGDTRSNIGTFYNRPHGGGYCGNEPYTSSVAANYRNVLVQNNLFLRGQTILYGTDKQAQALSAFSNEGVAEGSCDHWPWYSTGCTASGDPGYLYFYNNYADDTYVQNVLYQGYITSWTDGAWSGNTNAGGDQSLTNEAGRDYTPTASSTGLCGQGRSQNMPVRDFNGDVRQNADIGAIRC